MSLCGGLLQPEPCLPDIERRTAPRQQHPAKIELRLLMSFLGSRFHPPERLLIVLRHAAARSIERGQLVLRLGIAGLRRRA